MSHFSGATYSPERDQSRLTAQLNDVRELMQDQQYRTLAGIAAHCMAPEASVSARLRDLRKERFGAHTVNRRYLGAGLYEYQLVLNPNGSTQP